MHAIVASDVWIDKLALFISQRCALLIRCLPKMPPSSSTSTDSQIATWKRSLAWTTSRMRLGSSTTVDGEDFRLTTGVSSPNPVQRDILPHRHSQLSDLTIRLYTTISLKSISLKRWLYHQMFSDQFISQDTNHVTSHSSFLLVNRLTADVYRYDDHKYVNVHIHQLFIFSEINNG